MQSQHSLRWLSPVVLALLLGLFTYSASAKSARFWEPQSFNIATSDYSKRVEPQGLFLSNNLTDQVQWDSYSLVVKGQRIFLQFVGLLYPIHESRSLSFT